jgi:murein DD-endopeptidase MepM/ murein hydrolase activator NlpD
MGGSILRHLGDGTEVIAEGFYIWSSAASDYVTYFSTRLHPMGIYKTHTGIDIGAGYGTAILVAADGVVTTYGNYIIIDHGKSKAIRLFTPT